MAIAIIASLPSSRTASGVLAVKPSTEELSTWSAAAFGWARRSRSATRTPRNRVLPQYGPPIGLETQVRVMSRSIIGIASNSAQVSWNGAATMPSTCSVHVSVDTRGSTRAVSMR